MPRIGIAAFSGRRQVPSARSRFRPRARMKPCGLKRVASWVLATKVRNVATFLEELTVWKITTVVDVRLNPISRKKGFSKKALTGRLPKRHRLLAYADVKESARTTARVSGCLSPPLPACGRRFRSLLDTATASEKIIELTELPRGSVWPSSCFEASELCCHRKYVLARSKRDSRYQQLTRRPHRYRGHRTPGVSSASYQEKHRFPSRSEQLSRNRF